MVQVRSTLPKRFPGNSLDNTPPNHPTARPFVAIQHSLMLQQYHPIASAHEVHSKEIGYEDETVWLYGRFYAAFHNNPSSPWC